MEMITLLGTKLKTMIFCAFSESEIVSDGYKINSWSMMINQFPLSLSNKTIFELYVPMGSIDRVQIDFLLDP